jgi:hypothetical protein
LPIRIVCPGAERADQLVTALDGFSTRIVSDGASPEVHVLLDAEASEHLVEIFDSIGRWVADGGSETCQVFFGNGDRSYTLFAVDGKPNDPTEFLLQRTIQLQTALESRVVIEQAKGVLAERLALSPDEAFEILRSSARSSGRKIHALAQDVVESRTMRPEIQRQLDRR